MLAVNSALTAAVVQLTKDVKVEDIKTGADVSGRRRLSLDGSPPPDSGAAEGEYTTKGGKGLGVHHLMAHFRARRHPPPTGTPLAGTHDLLPSPSPSPRARRHLLDGDPCDSLVDATELGPGQWCWEAAEQDDFADCGDYYRKLPEGEGTEGDIKFCVASTTADGSPTCSVLEDTFNCLGALVAKASIGGATEGAIEGAIEGMLASPAIDDDDASKLPAPAGGIFTGTEETCTLVREAITMLGNAETTAQVEVLFGGAMHVWTAEAGEYFDESTCAGEPCAGTFGIKGIRLHGDEGMSYSVTCNAAECAADPDNTWCPVLLEFGLDPEAETSRRQLHGRQLSGKPSTLSLPPTPPSPLIELSGGNSGSATNLQACTGECDADSQCASGLKCFQRSDGETIPGCKGNGNGKDWDYCYDPSYVDEWRRMGGGEWRRHWMTKTQLRGGNSGSAKNLQACTGECDSDSQCASGLKCFQRSNGAAVPGCKGTGGGRKWDYCFDPDWFAPLPPSPPAPTITCATKWSDYYNCACDKGECEGRTFIGGENVRCTGAHGCREAKATDGATLTCTENGSCNKATFSDESTAHCAYNSCQKAKFQGNSQAYCTKNYACSDAEFSGNAVAHCNGDSGSQSWKTCLHAKFTGNACCKGKDCCEGYGPCKRCSR